MNYYDEVADFLAMHLC